MQIGDVFPDELKQRVANNTTLCPGQILYLFCDFTTPAPKNKYFLVASLDPLMLMFVINSGINNFVKRSPDMLECQILLEKANYDFLDHDSILACHEPNKAFTIDKVKEQIQNDSSRLRGKIIQTDRDKVIKVLSKSRIIDFYTRVPMINSLRSITY